MTTTEAGQLIIKIIADTTKAEKGIKTTKDTLTQLAKTTQTTSKTIDTLQDTLDHTGTTLQDTTQDLNKYTTATTKTTTAAKTASEEQTTLTTTLNQTATAATHTATQTQTTGDKIKQTGDKTKDTTKDLIGLNDAATKLKNALSITALGGALIAGATYMLNLQKQTAEAYQNFLTLKQNTTAATTALNTYNQAIKNLQGTDEPTEARAGEYMARYFSDLSMEKGGYGQQLAQYALQVSQTSGIDIGDLLRQLSKINTDYNLDQNQTLATLQQLVTLADQTQKGGTYETNLADTLTALTTYDKLYTSSTSGLNMDYQDVISLFAAWGQTYKTATEASADLQREYQNQQTEIAAAIETLPDLRTELTDNLEHLATLQQELNTTQGENTQTIQQEIEKTKDTIQQLQTLLTETQTLATTTPGTRLNTLLNTTTLTDQQLYTLLAGKDKDETLDTIKTARTRTTTTTPTYGTNTYTLPQRTDLAFLWGDFWQNVGADLKSTWFDPSETGELKHTAYGLVDAMWRLQVSNEISTDAYTNLTDRYHTLLKSADKAYDIDSWNQLVTDMQTLIDTTTQTPHTITIYQNNTFNEPTDTYTARQLATYTADTLTKSGSRQY